MKLYLAKSVGAGTLALSLLSISDLSAQTRFVLPEGSVIMVRTATPLESATATVGQSFETTVEENLGVDNFTVIPAGSRIRGVVTSAQPASRQQSGVIGISFDRLTLPDGTRHNLSATLTSTNPEERQQIESDPNSRVLLIGGRGGLGAAIAAAGDDTGSASGIFGALGALLSEGRNVSVPAGSQLAVQLEQNLVLRAQGAARAPDAFTIYTATDHIRAAQQALARQNYYRGPVTGQLDYPTQRALFEFQIDRGIIGTGNLDGRTAEALGIASPAAAAGVAVLSAEEASLVRRGAQALVGRYRQDLSISNNGQLNARRAYTDAEIELWFALSAFADNSSLYEPLVRSPGNATNAGAANRALISAARTVDSAMQRARATAPVQNAWSNIRTQLSEVDPTYR